MSSLEDKTIQYKNKIKDNFKAYNDNKKDSVKAQKLKEFLNTTNSNDKNMFINDSLNSLIELKQEEEDDNISPEEYISFIENQLDNNKAKNGLKNIFNVFCDSTEGKISWNKFPLIAKELGDDNTANNLMNVIIQSKLYSKELNYEQFLDIMNSNSDEEKEPINQKNNINNKILRNNNQNEDLNLKINDYIDNYEDKPTYKQRKKIQNKKKEYEEEIKEITSSSKSINKETDEIITEEKSSDYKINENDINNDNEKISKRYHRRYRSKNNPSYNKENNNTENINYNHKSSNKYRKKHIYH